MAQTITHGEFAYRTAAMDRSAAQAFARCLMANATRFMNVEVSPANRTKTQKCFVTFQPRSEARREAIKQEQQESRADRALEQPFLFWQDPDVPRLVWCYSAKSGETHQVTSVDCSCPDFHYRCRQSGLRCKHMIACTLWRRERAAAMIAEDFC